MLGARHWTMRIINLKFHSWLVKGSIAIKALDEESDSETFPFLFFPLFII